LSEGNIQLSVKRYQGTGLFRRLFDKVATRAFAPRMNPGFGCMRA
jgi:hypothetical protein